MRAPVPMRGPDGKMRTVNQVEDRTRRAREEALEALVDTPGWAVLTGGLERHLRHIRENLAVGVHLELWEVRALQERHRVLSDLARDPVRFLLQFDKEG